MMSLEGTTRRILTTLVTRDSPTGMRLSEIAHAVDLAPPTVLAKLRRLVQEKWVEAHAVQQAGATYTAYRAAQTVGIQWVDRSRGFVDAWTSCEPVDWRFPLVSRVPDQDAQRFLLEWLDRSQARGCLPPYHSRHEPAILPRVQVVVYGSCARGEAGTKADLDILLTSAPEWGGSQAMVELAHEVGLEHPRPLDLQIITSNEWHHLGPDFRKNLMYDAITVWSNDADAPFLEDPLEVRHES